MTEHTVRSFDEDLQALTRRVAEMGGLVERLIDDAVTALTRADSERANRVIADDRTVDDLHREIEEKAILLIARRQPVAVDLRLVIAALRISHDIERIGDLAKNIAKRALAIEGQFQPRSLIVGVEHMTQLALGQVKAVLDAYTARDDAAALAVRRRDDEIDTLFNSLFRELLTYMMEDPRNISLCTHLLFCAKNIERIGDHATNIAETVHYTVTGEQMRDERPKADETSLTAIPYVERK